MVEVWLSGWLPKQSVKYSFCNFLRLIEIYKRYNIFQTTLQSVIFKSWSFSNYITISSLLIAMNSHIANAAVNILLHYSIIFAWLVLSVLSVDFTYSYVSDYVERSMFICSVTSCCFGLNSILSYMHTDTVSITGPILIQRQIQLKIQFKFNSKTNSKTKSGMPIHLMCNMYINQMSFWDYCLLCLVSVNIFDLTSRWLAQEVVNSWDILVAILLQLGGVEPYPSPLSKQYLYFGVLNKTASIHALLEDEDIIALTEIWMRQDNKCSTAQTDLPGYTIHHILWITKWGGGLAVIHWESVKIMTNLSNCLFFNHSSQHFFHGDIYGQPGWHMFLLTWSFYQRFYCHLLCFKTLFFSSQHAKDLTLSHRTWVAILSIVTLLKM